MTGDSALSVTAALNLARTALEGIRLRVVGEVSEVSDKPGYKAVYFTVCDPGASMACLMWRDDYLACGTVLRCGMLVELEGRFSAYVPKGRMQFQVRSLAPAGEGRLRLQVAELARRLEAEGLMRAERKRALPPYPERIAVVTSPRGKAVHDVLRTLKRRYPVAEVLLFGVAVEGADAPEQIVYGLAEASAANPDVILLVRGGGSYEDLMPFNSELVARAVSASTVPVVTGIGHEPDTTIADMVADLRASTPTAAAEAASPSCEAIASTLERERRLLARALSHRVDAASARVRQAASRPVIRDPHVLLGSAEQAVDAARDALQKAIPRRLEADLARLDVLRRRMRTAGDVLTAGPESDLRVAAARLEDLSPLAILKRGYAVARTGDGGIIKSVDRVKVGDDVLVRVADGTIDCRVTGTAKMTTEET